MIVYIGFAQPDEWVNWAATYAKHTRKFEDAAGGVFCLTIPYNRVSPDLMRRLNPQAVIMSGFARSFQDYDVKEFYPVADYVDHATKTPILALCGSHQLLGFQFDGRLRTQAKLFDEPIRKRRPDDPAHNADYHPEYFMERGFTDLIVHVHDPLFAGCSKPPKLFESHYCEVKQTPPGFGLLASTTNCKVQAIRHKHRPLIGVQFHPEEYNEQYPDGKRVLENFFREARVRKGAADD